MKRDIEQDLDNVSIENLLLRENRHYRELTRVRNSLAFKLGVEIVKAIKFPPRIILLPFILPWQIIDYGLGRLGKNKYKQADLQSVTRKRRKSIVMFPTNGVGFGHFTRLLSVSRAIKKIDSEVEIVFFTTMSTLHLCKSEGIISYRIPGRKEFENLDAAEWNALTEEMLSTIFSAHRPMIFLFDGAFPYRGMLNSINGRNDIKRIWLKRGTMKKGATNIPRDSLEHFDHIIRPQDSVKSLISDEFPSDLDIVQCNPIILLERNELFSREISRSRLGISQHLTVVYIQLGAGNINQIGKIIEQCIQILQKVKNVHVVIGESIIGKQVEISGSRVQILRDYPNSLYFNGFDFAIIAGGYNSYHEAIYHALPSICIPNTNTGMDDQLARANVAGRNKSMLVLDEPVMADLEESIAKMLDPEFRSQLKAKCAEDSQSNGAEDSAKFILKMIDES
ncbi:MAG: hypothetical protein ACJZ6A_05270 [Candidatus Poseidoniaceae archaeon]